jgi:hypothetical protein
MYVDFKVNDNPNLSNWNAIRYFVNIFGTNIKQI